MENMDTVPKWVLIVRPKIPQMTQNLSAQFVCPTPKYKVDHDYAIDSYISGSVWEGRNQSKFSMMSSVQAITSSTIGTSWKK